MLLDASIRKLDELLRSSGLGDQSVSKAQFSSDRIVDEINEVTNSLLDNLLEDGVITKKIRSDYTAMMG